jgi:ABC-type branched-subunit amino acid transport system substrate-binding protein
VAFQFLGGVETAKTLHPPMGVSIKWEVFNTGEQDDSLLIKKLLDSGNLKDFDFIVGPLYASGLSQVADYAASYKIPLLSPTVRSSAILEGNPFVIKGAASPESFNVGLAEYIQKKFSNVILYYPANSADSAQLNQLYSELKRLNGVSVHQAFAGKNSPMDFVKPGADNLIYFPAKNELTVSNFLTGMRNVKKADRITVMGDESWLRFRNFDADYFNLVNLHVPVNLYSSNEIDELKPFVKAFRDNYKTAPEVYAYKGFDAACFVTDMLESFGASLPECIVFETPRYTMAPFRLKKVQGGGFENQGVLVVRVENYKLLLETN